MTEDPKQPEGEEPEEAPDQAAPGEGGGAAPGEPGRAAPAGEEAPEGESPPAGEAPGEPSEAAPAGEAPEPAEAAPAGEAPGEPGEAAPAGEAPEQAAPGEPGEAAEPEAEGEAPVPDEAAGVAPGDRPRPGGRKRPEGEKAADEVIPGAHLEPDLVLEEKPATADEGEYGEFDRYVDSEGEPPEGAAPEEAAPEDAPVARTPLELAADARYGATGKRKSAVARVILKPGEGTYSVNGRHLDEYFPRVRLQRMARQPLEAAGYQTRMDVVARIHGGGVSAQATALRHGIARALVEADPALRGELKRRGYLTRDPRVKERKKAGLKKARKRPQFSKR